MSKRHPTTDVSLLLSLSFSYYNSHHKYQREDLKKSIICLLNLRFCSIDPEATEEFIGNMVGTLKTFYNSFWAILSRTRTQEKQDGILDVFYGRLRDLVAADPLCYKAEETIIVLQIAKL